MNLHQKLIEIRKTVPRIPKTSNPNVSYKSIDINDIYEKITPAMNDVGIIFRTVSEENAKMQTHTQTTKSGERTMFIYESDVSVQWVNADDPNDNIPAQFHTIAFQDDPAKAKGSAWTYALKYFFCAQFGIDQGDDPDKNDNSGKFKSNSKSGGTTTDIAPKSSVSEKQLARFFAIMHGAGFDPQSAVAECCRAYGILPEQLSRQQYDEICEHWEKQKR